MNHNPENTVPRNAFPTLSAQDFQFWGLNHIAYVRPIEIGDAETGKRILYGVFAADGRQIGLMADPDIARAAIRQNDLEPLSVH